MSEDLKAALMEIDGIGDVKSDQILAVLADHDTGVDADIQTAIEHLEAGMPERALKFLRGDA